MLLRYERVDVRVEEEVHRKVDVQTPSPTRTTRSAGVRSGGGGRGGETEDLDAVRRVARRGGEKPGGQRRAAAWLSWGKHLPPYVESGILRW